MTVDAFGDALAALGNASETVMIVEALVARASRHPGPVRNPPDRELHVLRSRSYQSYPALKLFYSVDAEAVYLLWIEAYDELEG